MKFPLASILVIAMLSGCGGSDSPHGALKAMAPDEALQALLSGNRRYVDGTLASRHGVTRRRAELATGQKPFAVIVCCSDSRVGPEVVFDQGLGDIFVIRTAGEVVDEIGLASIEYAVEHLGTTLVVVLGHERCGAVTAALAGGEAPGHIGALVKAIRPAVEESKGEPGDALDNAVRAQVRGVVRQLRGSTPILSELVHEGKVEIVGARYDLDTGLVEVVTAETGKH